jgi:hypothetical protein
MTTTQRVKMREKGEALAARTQALIRGAGQAVEVSYLAGVFNAVGPEAGVRAAAEMFREAGMRVTVETHDWLEGVGGWSALGEVESELPPCNCPLPGPGMGCGCRSSRHGLAYASDEWCNCRCHRS